MQNMQEVAVLHNIYAKQARLEEPDRIYKILRQMQTLDQHIAPEPRFQYK
jgi:hypothetical protein